MGLKGNMDEAGLEQSIINHLKDGQDMNMCLRER